MPEAAVSIPLPFAPESVLQVLAWGASPDEAPHAHKEIAEWCDAFWCRYLDTDAPPEIERLMPILADVETQWDLYLANTYSSEELRLHSFDNERMPVEWFTHWIRDAHER